MIMPGTGKKKAGVSVVEGGTMVVVLSLRSCQKGLEARVDRMPLT